MSRRFLVLDSGIGGLSVAREVRRAMPAAEIVYVADDACFPYGERDETELTNHVVDLVAALADEIRADVVVVACNTASTLVLAPLRERLTVPVVGTVPAIKTAAERTRSGRFAVLATPGTIARDYTHDLIRQYAQETHVRLVGSYRLAPLAEAHMRGEHVDRDAVRHEIRHAFFRVDGVRSDTVVLGCTHYVFLRDILEACSAWPVVWIDAAPAIAARAITVAGETAGSGADDAAGGGAAILTSGETWHPHLLPLLAEIGLAPVNGHHGDRA